MNTVNDLSAGSARLLQRGQAQAESLIDKHIQQTVEWSNE